MSKKAPDDKNQFNCDVCGHDFEWDDNCADFDELIFNLSLRCKKCRGDQTNAERFDPDGWKKE